MGYEYPCSGCCCFFYVCSDIASVQYQDMILTAPDSSLTHMELSIHPTEPFWPNIGGYSFDLVCRSGVTHLDITNLSTGPPAGSYVSASFDDILKKWTFNTNTGQPLLWGGGQITIQSVLCPCGGCLNNNTPVAWDVPLSGFGNGFMQTSLLNGDWQLGNKQNSTTPGQTCTWEYPRGGQQPAGGQTLPLIILVS